MVRIILNGCNGAMGKMLANIIAQDELAQVVAGIDITQAADTPFPVFESIKACDVEADALIDFTVSKITDMVLDQCAQKGLALVLATTGLPISSLLMCRRQEKQFRLYSPITCLLESIHLQRSWSLLRLYLQTLDLISRS